MDRNNNLKTQMSFTDECNPNELLKLNNVGATFSKVHVHMHLLWVYMDNQLGWNKNLIHFKKFCVPFCFAPLCLDMTAPLCVCLSIFVSKNQWQRHFIFLNRQPLMCRWKCKIYFMNKFIWCFLDENG